MFRCEFPAFEVQNLAVKLTPKAENLLLKTAHPWIFSKSIERMNKEGKVGDIAILFRQKTNDVFGVGLYDPSSSIPIKMLHYYSAIQINQSFFAYKIQEAYSIRKPLLASDTNSYRLIFGENDNFPGLIADVYARTLVVKLYSAIWFPYLKSILIELIKATSCEVAVLRLSRNLQKANSSPFYEGQILYGELDNAEVIFKEHGIIFSTNVIKGHKTGYFLDHRANRKRVGELALSKNILDVFSYTGGFSVHALIGGAKEVTSVDISEKALTMARVNVSLNASAGKHITLAGDAFSILKRLIDEQKIYDMVIIDPPSFAKSKKEEEKANFNYQQLARLGSRLVSSGGILILASCSSRLSEKDFFRINERALASAGRTFNYIGKYNHDIDHPVSFKEGAYLKCGFYQL